MALQTPIPRRSTFLLSTNLHDQSYIPNTPPPTPHKIHHQNRKRPLSNSSPIRVRRRLLFSDLDTCCDQLFSQTSFIEVSSTLRRLAIALADDAPGSQRIPIWNDILLELRCNPCLAAARFLSDELFELFRDGNDINEILIALNVVNQLFNTTGASPDEICSPKVIQVMISTATRFLNNERIVSTVAHLAMEYAWASIYSNDISIVAQSVRKLLLTRMCDHSISSNMFASLMILFTVCTDAQRRLSNGNASPDSICTVEKSCLDKQNKICITPLNSNEVRIIVQSFAKMAMNDDTCTEKVLTCLSILFMDMEIVSLFAHHNIHSVISQLSVHFSHKIQIHHACVNILLQLSSPRAQMMLPTAGV